MFALSQYVILADRWPRRLIALLGGACGALALAPVDFFPAFAIPMVLSVWLLDGSAGDSLAMSLWRAGEAGWWLGFGYFLAGLWWLGAAFFADGGQFAWALPLGVIGLPAFLAFFTALGFVLARLLWSSSPRRIFALTAQSQIAKYAEGTEISDGSRKVVDGFLARDAEEGYSTFALAWFEDHKDQIQKEKGVPVENVSDEWKINMVLGSTQKEEWEFQREIKEGKYKCDRR